VSLFYDYAAAYVSLNLPVLPLMPLRHALDGSLTCRCRKKADCPTPGKHPCWWHVPAGSTDASTDLAKIAQWWSGEDWTSANLGVATGDTVVVIDVDPRHGGDGALAELEARHGALPLTWKVVTGSGGWHLYFRPPAGANIANSAGTIGKGVDVRGYGGLVVAPPSLHITGRRYVWETGCAPWELALAELPPWLGTSRNPSGKVTPPSAWRTLVNDGAVEGERNTKLHKLACMLFRPPFKGIDYEVALVLLSCWNAAHCTPPLGEDELETLTRSAHDFTRSQARLRSVRR
jgi:hypothetical protein